MWYISRVIYPPKWFFEQIKKTVRSFIWGKKDKIKYTTIIGLKEEGGIKLPDVEMRVNSQHLLWLRTIF